MGSDEGYGWEFKSHPQNGEKQAQNALSLFLFHAFPAFELLKVLPVSPPPTFSPPLLVYNAASVNYLSMNISLNEPFCYIWQLNQGGYG